MKINVLMMFGVMMSAMTCFAQQKSEVETAMSLAEKTGRPILAVAGNKT